ncbi:MAG: hypothetical protein Ct9H300mP21_00900 [Pseudomonadota bacterium]|nr:MAG: hypothetical protein Ct9H300mP21_00900 [Pseudomonadota bacterium]
MGLAENLKQSISTCIVFSGGVEMNKRVQEERSKMKNPQRNHWGPLIINGRKIYIIESSARR